MLRTGPELSVIIPMYNEESHLVESLRTIIRHVKACVTDYELIVIDDGSTDGTWLSLQELAAVTPGMTAMRLSRNFGKELALCAGLESCKGKAVLVMDGDLQHPPELIQDMIRHWRVDRYDIVECYKVDRGQESIVNKVGAAIYYRMLNKFTGYDMKNASDFKLLDAKVVRAWRAMPEKNTFFRGMTAWTGFRRFSIPFEVPPREHGGSRWGTLKLAKLAIESIISFSTLPLKLVSLAGLGFSLGAIVLGAISVVEKLRGKAFTGFTTVYLLQLLIGGLVLFALGIIGEYIAAIYQEVKGRPRYLVQAQASYQEATLHPSYLDEVAAASADE